MRFPTTAALLCLPLVALAGALPAAGQDSGAGDVFPYPVHRTVLDNGLQVVVVPYDSPGVVAYYSVVRTGSRQEVEPGHSGFAHFFEHMMFRGTETYSTEEYNDALKAMGADSNAFTTDDWTNYYVVGPAAELEKIMELESDRFLNLEYTEPEFRTEAQAVLGEYNMNASNPFRALHERLRELAFEEHTYEHTTLGFLDDIKAMPGYYDYSLSFFDRFYRPENVIVLVVGDVEPERVASLARTYYGAWEPGYQPVEIATEPPQTERRVAEVPWPNPTRPHLTMGWHVPAFDTATVDTAALDLIGELLFSENAPLYKELVVEKQLVEFISGGAPFRRDPYIFTVTTRLRSEEAVGEVEATLARYLQGLKDAPVDRERLDRIKSHLRYDFALALDSAPSVAVIVAEFLNLTGDPESINRLYRQYQAVTPEDVQRVTREVFKESNQTVIRLAHAGAAAAGEGEGAADGESGEGGE
ncbi:MAG TPA: pitrilysin family protein [Thermoanaerobaculia bacterium]|nr:pitrilysin family protein [Thermoanaerobaculia bacterium]